MDVGRNSKKLCTITLILFLFVSLANGRTITVGTGLGYDYTTIQAAINAAQEGDTVIVAQGTYIEPVRFRGINIVLTSTDPNSWNVIENTEIEYDDSSVVTFRGEEDESCVLQGFTISRGDNRYGGGICGNGTRATIRRCYIRYNDAELGGGLYDCDGLIEDCVIERNSGRRRNWTNKGGGLYGCDGIINNCIIEDNEAGHRDNPDLLNEGGGLHSCNGQIIGCTIEGNLARGNGGGLHSCNGQIIGCTIENNYVIGNGGGLYGCNGSVIDCIINDNFSEDSGGGLSMCMGSVENCTIQDNISPNWHGGGAADCNSFMNCLITGNATRGNGGGLHNCREVVNCTIVGNYSMGQGGAIYYRGNYGIINNSIIWDNIAVDIGQILVECNESNSALWNLSVDYSNIQGGLESVIVGEGCTLQWERNNIDMDPLFVLPGSWTVENVWLEGDYHLLFGSPCINAGDPNKDYTGQTDIDKQERVFGQYVDIGADENFYVEPAFEELVVKGPQEVTEGNAAQYTAIARYDDNSEIDVTNGVTWTVEPEGIGTINTAGLFTVGELDVSVEVIIKAEYVVEQVLYAAQKIVLCRALPEPPTIYHVDTVTGSDENDGLSRGTALKTIQRGINAAQDDEMVLVYPGVYIGEINFLGKAVTVQSVAGAAVLENPDDFAVSFYHGEGPDSVLKNFIIKDSFMGIFIAGSSPTISNVTVVGNKYGIEAYAGSEPDISNSIFWNNTDGDLFGCEARYSCIERGGEGEGNITVDPLFVDPDNGDYHLRSERGRYWPEHDIWVLDKITSPCVDGGDPNADPLDEPMPNGGRINMGAYGSTSEASLSPWQQPYLLGQAFNPTPASGAIDVDVNIILKWAAGFDAVLHNVYFGTNVDDMDMMLVSLYQTRTEFELERLGYGITYYWRIDEVDSEGNKTTGDVWTFTTIPPLSGKASNPYPADGAVGVNRNVTLSWTPGFDAALHNVYFGVNFDNVNQSNVDDDTWGVLVSQGQAGSAYDPAGLLEFGQTYYWRIDEYNTDETISKGHVWSFTTANFLVVDDIEDYNDYDPDRIFDIWMDGWGDPENDSEVGYGDIDFVAGEHHVETTIVHGGGQSMPYFYDNTTAKYSEATMTLVWLRDWTQDGVGVLSLWFYGNASNAAERMYVALNGYASVYHDNPDVALIDEWTEWTIDLHEFATQGVNLANVNTISIGFGDKNNPQAGGSGLVFFDDIRLYRPYWPAPDW